MIWYLTDLQRFRAEREILEVFSRSVDWLTPIRWRMDKDLHLILDAEITAGGRVYSIFLQYPSQFPATPPSVFPRDTSSRWSSHQFGVGGELCLEFGPDNWTPDMTGKHMIESAHKLLEIENPAPNERGIVASRHATTLGQSLRTEYNRLLITGELEGFFATLPVGEPVTGNLLGAFHKNQIVNIIDKITLAGGKTWTDQSVPDPISQELMEREIDIFRLPPDAKIPPTGNFEEFKAACATFGFQVTRSYAVLLKGQSIYAYFIWKNDNSVSDLGIIPFQTQMSRLDASHEILKSRHVALIGCGSLGSKIGAMLARSGVGRFFLVDDDVLLPDNFVRHDLDWRDVGTHKADAVARRMQLINPSVRTHIRRIKLAGQEASGSAETVLNSIEECDLIVDATANPDVLNLVSMIVTKAGKPIIWAEVFGGGIGGLIARCRPAIEPPPQYMRRAVENWFAEKGPLPIRAQRNYETDQDGDPLIANDADVTAIAAHAARLAIDTLIDRNPSQFPNSVYAIGLGSGSVFSQPFETFPIEVGSAFKEEKAEELSPEIAVVELASITSMFEILKNEIASTPKDNQTPEA